MISWEYCEVAYTPKHVIVHVYSSRYNGAYEGVQTVEEWGALLAQLGDDGWEMVGVVPAKPANHSLYYFKRPIDTLAPTILLGAPITLGNSQSDNPTKPLAQTTRSSETTTDQPQHE